MMNIRENLPVWFENQWLWDREKKQPVQFIRVELLPDPGRTSRAIFHVREIREVLVGALIYNLLIETAHPFNGYQWWQERYTELYIPAVHITPENTARPKFLTDIAK